MLELVLLAVVAVIAAALTRLGNRKRGERRAVAGRETGSYRIPCRVSWPEGTGHRGFVYGMMHASPDGIVDFHWRNEKAVAFPAKGAVRRARTWRVGIEEICYTSPDAGVVRVLANESDAEVVENILVLLSRSR